MPTVTGADSHWNNFGDLQIAPVGSGRLNVADGGVVTVGGVLSVGALGVLTGNGSLVGNVSNGAAAPGNSAGALSIDGNYAQFSAGTLFNGLGGVTPVIGDETRLRRASRPRTLSLLNESLR